MKYALRELPEAEVVQCCQVDELITWEVISHKVQAGIEMVKCMCEICKNPQCDECNAFLMINTAEIDDIDPFDIPWMLRNRKIPMEA